MTRGRAWRWALLGALAAAGFPRAADALGAERARGRAMLAVKNVERDTASVHAAVARAQRAQLTPEKRLAAGDILLRQKDYESAIHVFSQIVELHAQGKASQASYGEAVYLLGEAYFQDKQYLSARRQLNLVLENGARPPFDRFAGRALSRLVDIVLRTNDLENLEVLMSRMNQLPASDSTGSLQYARGKVLFAKKEYSSAKATLGAVPAGSDYAHQAQYVVGAILVQEEAPAPAPELPTEAVSTGGGDSGTTAAASPPRRRYAQAIEQFRRVTRLTPDSEEHRHVIDLAWMAIGRLLYESDNYLDAAEAYSHVDRKSPEFTNMLYELAWVYVRLGDFRRAQRALEVLTIADPDSVHFADGSLLRADLMLRSGQFDKALTLYESVRSQFDPIREQVDAFLASTSDPAVYYDRLVEDPLEREGDAIPQLALDWAREAAEGDRTFAVIDDVTRSRDLIKKSRLLAQKLNAVLGSSTRAKAFPELRAGLEQTLALLNKLALARRTLALGLDDVSPGPGTGQVAALRRERRSLMKRMKWLPVTPGDFTRREARGERQWNTVSQALQRLTLEADKLQAIINGLKRVLEDADQHGVVHDVRSRQRFEQELQANERDLALYRKRIRDYRHAIDVGRVQIGFGDQRYVEDDRVRARFREVFGQEVQLLAGGGGAGSAYARGIRDILQRADSAEATLETTRADLDRKIEAKASGLRRQVLQEAANVEQYSDQLDTLDQQARLLVGEMAMRNFGLVRDRLKGIVLRADVGIVQEAWELREEQRVRVRNLQRERSREEQNLNDELREVVDDAGGDQ